MLRSRNSDEQVGRGSGEGEEEGGRREDEGEGEEEGGGSEGQLGPQGFRELLLE